MKDEDLEAVQLLRQMGRLVVPALASSAEAGRNERMAVAVNRLLSSFPRERPPRRLRARALAPLAAAAAALAVVFGAYHWLRPPSAPTSNEVARVISASGASTLWRVGASPRLLVAELGVNAADELRSTSGSRAELSLTGAGKAKVEVWEDTRVRLNQRATAAGTASEDWLDLEQGQVTLQVAKLSPGLGLWVQTPEARVTVHGTRFSVRVTPRAASGTVTFVDVTEGRVEVDSRGQMLVLGPGEHWSSQEVVPSPPPTLEVRAGERPQSGELREELREAAHRAAPAVSGRVVAGSGGPNDSSTLAEENRIYAQAMARAEAGEWSPALAGLADLIRRYPRSPLAQNARVDRFRLLRQSGNGSAAAQEARRYLSEYPNGFARVEARRLALQGLESPQ